ncbi:hypothetical protein GQ457_13G015860 [Hibiscus cannabinus]
MMCSGGAASSDWARAGGGEELGVVPKCVSGVLARLCSCAAGVVAGLVVVVWLEIGTTGGEAGGVCYGSAGADGAEGLASTVGAATAGVGLARAVGMATLRGVRLPHPFYACKRPASSQSSLAGICHHRGWA